MVPGILTVSTATLSLAATVNTTVWLWDDVVNSTVVSLAVKLLIDGFWSSTLLILIDTVSVTLLPAVSLTVNVSVSLLLPKPKSS